MSKSKTKKALIGSAGALVLCFALLLGTTFAWFTDNAQTKVNKIQAGNLDIALEMAAGTNDNGTTKWVSAEGKTLSFINEKGNAVENALWEPGCTYYTDDLRIVNKGNLALKFKVDVTGLTGDAKLNEAIDWGLLNARDSEPGSEYDYTWSWKNTSNEESFSPLDDEFYLLPGECVYMQLIAEMDQNAGNQYQGLSIDGIAITVLATQYTCEYDSTGNGYDADADYSHIVSTLEELQSALSEGGNISLAGDIEVTEQLVIPKGVSVNLDMNGKSLSLADGASADSCDPMMNVKNGASLTIDGNGTVDLGANPGFSFMYPCGDVTINSGTFKIDTELKSYGSFFVGINNGKGKLVINGGYFDGGYYEEGDCFNNCRNLLNGSWGQSIRVYGGTFVAQNPAWGDEGMAFLCPHCEHVAGKGYCQALFLEGQSREGTELPAGYSIIEGVTDDGRPTYTVNYSK